MRVVRTIVLLAFVAVLLPSPPEEQEYGASDAVSDLPATELLTAAISTVSDMGAFCSRQPAVCDTAHYVAVKLEGKARYGIELLYQWAHESNNAAAPMQASRDDNSRSLSSAEGEVEKAGANTLRLEDLIPEWRAPKPARQG